MKSLEGKLAIITGGASRIDRETTLTFFKEGATVIIWNINKASAEKTQKLAGDLQSAVEFIQVDTRNYKEVKTLNQSWRKLEVLYNQSRKQRCIRFLRKWRK